MKTPGISRDNRISDEGLQRLRRQLESGAQLSPLIIEQWVKRYGEPVRDLLKQFDIKS